MLYLDVIAENILIMCESGQQNIVFAFLLIYKSIIPKFDYLRIIFFAMRNITTTASLELMRGKPYE